MITIGKEQVHLAFGKGTIGVGSLFLEENSSGNMVGLIGLDALKEPLEIGTTIENKNSPVMKRLVVLAGILKTNGYITRLQGLE